MPTTGTTASADASGPTMAVLVDILGEGGLAVAPPSVRPSGGKYAFLRGGLADLANLPKIRSLRNLEPGPPPRLDEGIHSTSAAPIGRRNDTVFRAALVAKVQDVDLAR